MSCEDAKEGLLFACAALATHAHPRARRCGGLTTRGGCAIHKVHLRRRLLLRCIGTWGIIRARPGTGAGNSLRGGFKPNISNKAFRSPGRTTASHRWSPMRWSSARRGGGTSLTNRGTPPAARPFVAKAKTPPHPRMSAGSARSATRSYWGVTFAGVPGYHRAFQSRLWQLACGPPPSRDRSAMSVLKQWRARP